MTSIHKEVPSNVPGNYWPISVVPVVAKLLEKIVAHQLQSYFESQFSSGCLLQGQSN